MVGKNTLNNKYVVGVLALQGDYYAHARMLMKIGVQYREIRLPNDLENVDALVIPGGESTTVLKLLARFQLESELIKFKNSYKPILGTCAGTIIVADKLVHSNQKTLKFIGIEVERNAYGRQVDSFETSAQDSRFGAEPIPLVFIRAPIIRKCSNAVDKLLICNDNVVLAREKNVLVATFHPELTNDERIHRYFLSMIDE